MYIDFIFIFSFFHKNWDIVRVCIFVSFFLSICQLKILLLFSLFSKFLSEKFLSKGIFFKIKFKFLKYHKVMHIHLSNKVLNTVMQKQSIVKFLFYYDFYFLTIYIYHLHRAQRTSTNTPLTRYVDKLIVVNTYCKC